MESFLGFVDRCVLPFGLFMSLFSFRLVLWWFPLGFVGGSVVRWYVYLLVSIALLTWWFCLGLLLVWFSFCC